MSSSNEMVTVRADDLAKLQANAAGQTSLWGKAKHYGGVAAPYAKAIVPPLAIGGLVAVLAHSKDIREWDTVKKYWWLLPMAVLILGYYYQRKGDPKGALIMVAGALLFVQAYQAQPKTEATAQNTSTTTTKSDTGDPTPVGPMQFHRVSDSVGWMRMPDGRWMRVQLAAPPPRQLPAPQPSLSTVTPQHDAAANLAAAAFS